MISWYISWLNFMRSGMGKFSWQLQISVFSSEFCDLFAGFMKLQQAFFDLAGIKYAVFMFKLNVFDVVLNSNFLLLSNSFYNKAR